MKKLLIFAVVAIALIFFNGCQKDELGHQLDDEAQPQEVVQPDVYLENGYLVFKNMEVVDSVKQFLESLTNEEVQVWEDNLDFKSAKTYFDPIFKEAEQLTTLESILAFKKKYEDVLKWNEDDLTDYSFDYPFYYTNLVSIMNKDGILKIGKSLFKYNKDNRITIFDGDFSKLETALSIEGDSENIQIIGNWNNLKSANTLVGLTNFAGQYGDDGSPNDDWWNWNSKRKMKTGLQFEDFIYINQWGGYEGYYKIYLWQRAQKKVLGVWLNYSVKYRYGSMSYMENNVLKASITGYVTSPSTQSTLWVIYTSPLFGLNHYNPEIPIPYPMHFNCTTTNEDFSYYPAGVYYDN